MKKILPEIVKTVLKPLAANLLRFIANKISSKKSRKDASENSADCDQASGDSGQIATSN